MLSAFRDLPDHDSLVAHLKRGATAVDGPEALAAERTALFNEVADAVRERTEGSPLVVFLDDLHWAGPDTLRLFAHLSRTVTEWLYPVLFLATYRSEAVAADDGFGAVVDRMTDADRTDHVRVGPLGAADSQGLVAWLADRPDLPEEFLTVVRERTGGNPLLIRETVQRLLDVGTLAADGDVPTDPDDVPLPEDVTRVVGTRVKVLPEATRRVLEAAAVAGETVAPELLSAGLDEPEASVNDHLDVLVTGRFLDRTGDSIAFVGGVVRDAILDSLPADRRRSLHAAVAAAIPSVYPDAARDRAARMAHHYERAGNRRAALETLSRPDRRVRRPTTSGRGTGGPHSRATAGRGTAPARSTPTRTRSRRTAAQSRWHGNSGTTPPGRRYWSRWATPNSRWAGTGRPASTSRRPATSPGTPPSASDSTSGGRRRSRTRGSTRPPSRPRGPAWHSRSTTPGTTDRPWKRDPRRVTDRPRPAMADPRLAGDRVRSGNTPTTLSGGPGIRPGRAPPPRPRYRDCCVPSRTPSNRPATCRPPAR